MLDYLFCFIVLGFLGYTPTFSFSYVILLIFVTFTFKLVVLGSIALLKD